MSRSARPPHRGASMGGNRRLPRVWRESRVASAINCAASASVLSAAPVRSELLTPRCRVRQCFPTPYMERSGGHSCGTASLRLRSRRDHLRPYPALARTSAYLSAPAPSRRGRRDSIVACRALLCPLWVAMVARFASCATNRFGPVSVLRL